MCIEQSVAVKKGGRSGWKRRSIRYVVV